MVARRTFLQERSPARRTIGPVTFRAAVAVFVGVLLLLGAALIVEAVFDSAVAAWVALMTILAFLAWRWADWVGVWWRDDS